MIEVVGLTQRYGEGLPALDRLSLRVRPGEIYALLGANGAGKTTTIRVLLGLVEPSEGYAAINGIDVARHPVRAKTMIGYVAENVALYRYLTARENIRFFASLGGGPRVHDRLVDEVTNRVGFPRTALNRRTGGLSKGMRQKVALAIAFLKDAPVLLLDEPTSGLDPKASVELMSILGRFRDEGKAVLLSTHDLFRAKAVADRVGILKHGEKIFEASRAELEHRDLEALYLSYMSDVAGPASGSGGAARSWDQEVNR